jgi:hypothetical protein
MRTTVYLDSKDIEFLKQRHGSNYFLEIKKKLLLNNLNNINIMLSDPIGNDSKLFLLYIRLEEWRLLNHWIIDNSTELFKPKIRDALLSL